MECRRPKSRILIDKDLDFLSREELVAEVIRLRNGIRQHRDCSGHDLCWYQPELWGLLPDKTDRLAVVPDWPQFMQGCVLYRKSLDSALHLHNDEDFSR